MNEDRWLTTIDKVDEKFGIVDRGEIDLEVPGSKGEYVVFESPVGKVMLERHVMPKYMGEKTTHGSRRSGSSVDIEKKYDMNQMVNSLHAFKWDEASDDWQPFEVEGIF